MFIIGRRHLPSVLSFGDPAFEFCSRQYHASTAFAGGAITDGVWGAQKTCYRCCGCNERSNQLNLLVIFGVTRRLSFTCMGCYKPDRCYSGVYKFRYAVGSNRPKANAYPLISKMSIAAGLRYPRRLKSCFHDLFPMEEKLCLKT